MRASDPPSTALLVLPVGAQRYAVALDAAREVLAAPETTPLPGAPGALVGLCNVRGAIVPLFDLALLHHRGMVTAPAFAVVVDAGAELAGFVTTERPWVGEARAAPRTGGGLRIRQGRRRVSAALLDVSALLPLDPPAAGQDTLPGAPLDPPVAGP